MPEQLRIDADPERLDEGTPEERACFAALTILYGNTCLTEGRDGFVNKVRPAPLLSGYHLAEWVAWNWWRLRWEPKSNAPGWAYAHHMAAIGEGYVWPNITFFSDGERVALVAKPTRERSGTLFRYLSDAVAVVSGKEFDYAMDRFIEQIRGLLREATRHDSNLDRIWTDICEERRNPETARRRKLEALLGHDPDEADTDTLDRLLTDAKIVGESAINEIAADYTQSHRMPTLESLRLAADHDGFDASPCDSVRLAADTALPRPSEAPAWRLGAAAAMAVRTQERLDGGPITNERLAAMAGVQSGALTDKPTSGLRLSFAIDDETSRSRIVLRSRWETGRRFELARLLGDRILSETGGSLYPATQAYTYRQKMQRAFAAELLSPFETLEQILAGDYSMESQQDAANYFQVSDLMIRTSLVNHRRLERDAIDDEFNVMAA